jgi:psp operon transcriptional activator
MLVQEKLLRVIEYGELERVGGSQPLQVNVRLVCATNADLPQMVEAGHFRADLLDRLAFDVVQLPPLRDRQSDIMLLANQFAIQMCRELGLPLFPGFSDRARETLLGYRWPGNIRELKNVVERSVYRHGTSDSELDNIIINPFHQPLPLQSPPQTLPRIPPGQRYLWICGPSSRNKKKPAADESAAGEVQSETGGGAAWVNLPPAAGAAQKHQL